MKKPIHKPNSIIRGKTRIKMKSVKSIPEIQVNNLTEYIELVETITTENSEKTILFRGQSQDFDLLPSIARRNSKQDTTELEEEILSEFKRRSRLKIDSDFIDDWDWLIFAQHFGLKTRLLDWSSNPLVGIWFCCSDKNDFDKDGVVYIFVVNNNHLLNRGKNESPFKRNTTRVYKPHLNNERIIAQSGWFTAHGYSTKMNNFVKLNRNTTLKPYLTKVVVPLDIKKDLIWKLNVLGINYERLFPDIEGICRQINHENEL